MTKDKPSPADVLRHQASENLLPIINQLSLAEKQQSWPLVEQLCKQALQQDSENFELWKRLAHSYESQADYVQAETLWRHLTQRFASKPEPYLALAALQRRRGASDSARVVLGEAEQRVGNSMEIQRSLGEIDNPWDFGTEIPQLAPGASAHDLAEALQNAQKHLDSGRFAEAEAVLEQILKAKPHAGKVHLSLAQLRQRRGRNVELVNQLEPLLRDSIVSVALQERLALTLLLVNVLLSQSCWQQADSFLEPLLANPADSDRVDLLLARAECAIGMNNDQAAIPWLERCLELKPEFSRAERLLAEVAVRSGDWPKAIAGLTRALALEPGVVEIGLLLERARCEQLWNRGEEALEQAAWHDAAEFYRQLLQLSPGYPMALERLDLLASLNPAELATGLENELVNNINKDDPAVRLAQVSARIDRIEAQLKILGVCI